MQLILEPGVKIFYFFTSDYLNSGIEGISLKSELSGGGYSALGVC